jgi:hypothetical protein
VQVNCAATPNLCDLKVFAVWTGSDFNGDFFRSAGLRFSRYLSFGLDSLYTNTLQAADSAFNNARIANGGD